MKKFEKFVSKSDLLFFSPKGESMSDANSMKGKCTQISEDVKANLNAIGPVKEIINFDGKEVNLINPSIVSNKELAEIVGKDAEANALNAWYSNAIESKLKLMSAIRQANWTLFLAEGETHTPELYTEKFLLEEPILDTFSEEDVLSNFSANDLADYFIKEQYCASIGKLIHRKGILHSLYNSPLSNTSKFIDLRDGSGVRSYPVIIEPVYQGKALTEIKEFYLKIHDDHRESEKQLNYYKANIKNLTSDLNAAAQKKYAKELDKFNSAKAVFMDNKSKAIEAARSSNNKIKASCEARREVLIKEASIIKIFIPENLRSIKKFVKEYKVL